MVVKWFGEPVQIVEEELVDFVTVEINREKVQWKRHQHIKPQGGAE